MIKRFGLAILTVVLATAAVAQEDVYATSDGTEYVASTAKDGALIMSREVLTLPVTDDAGTRDQDMIDVVFLGNDCVAKSEVFGLGTWGWANGGFVIELPGHSIGFPRQAPFWANGFDCPLE